MPALLGWRRIDVRVGASFLGLGLAGILAASDGHAGRGPGSRSAHRFHCLLGRGAPSDRDVDDPRSRFTDIKWYRERDQRRGGWMRRLEANPQALFEIPLRLPVGAQVTVLHDGGAHPQVIDGFGSLPAGCGEAEPAWRLRVRTTRASSGVVHAPAGSHERDDERADSGVHSTRVARFADPGPWHANDWAREHSPTGPCRSALPADPHHGLGVRSRHSWTARGRDVGPRAGRWPRPGLLRRPEGDVTKEPGVSVAGAHAGQGATGASKCASRRRW